MENVKSLSDEVLAHADIVNVISSFIPVISKGRSFVAVCPFHDDHHPSMSISREKGVFKCFSCGAAGNAISYVSQYLKIPYREAIKKVAELSGYHDARLESLSSRRSSTQGS